jgi:hypothetical protein
MPKKVKVKGRDNEASFTTKRVNFFNAKQKKKHSVENQDNFKDEGIASNDSDERITTNDLTESLETDAQVGAFAVSGNQGGASNEDEQVTKMKRLMKMKTLCLRHHNLRYNVVKTQRP